MSDLEPDPAKFWALSEAQLLTTLGGELLGEGISFSGEDEGRRRRFAQRWLDERADRIRETICDEPAIRAIMNRDLSDRLVDAATVIDALAAITGRPSATIVAVILLRRGAERVCGYG